MIGRLIRFFLYSIASLVLVSALLLTLYVRGLPDLEFWHTTALSSELRQDRGITSFETYLGLENRLFLELAEKDTQPMTRPDPLPLNRYVAGSRSHPDQQTWNGNRTFMLPLETPKACVLLLHGMSDSPYSLRRIGLALHRDGAWVLGLRLPGHGTFPSGLLDVTWEDMAAAVDLAMAYLAGQAPGKPIHIIGYSTGGALGLNYALTRTAGKAGPPLSGLVLISPAIGVTPAAVLAKWQERLSRLPGLAKLAWTGIGPEYNPFKYTSFAVNAGNQVFRLTRELHEKLAAAEAGGTLDGLPPILAFQSISDATVSTPALVRELFRRLSSPVHELVVFDINRRFGLKALIKKDGLPGLSALLDRTSTGFTLRLVTNRFTNGNQVQIRTRIPGKTDVMITDLGIAWPRGIYSLSHVALPFPEKDPLYGNRGAARGLNIGGAAVRGETGILNIPAPEILRLKWNPFYPYMETRIRETIQRGTLNGEKTDDTSG